MKSVPGSAVSEDDTLRACIECEAVYCGPLKCPMCAHGVGEPMEDE